MNRSSTAFIENITVEEGFLDGLDLSFQPGLNVIIGPRGTGKTSIIELIRFCLAAPALTERFQQRARDHARSILGDGRVTVCCVVDGERFLVSRRHLDEVPEGDVGASQRLAPIVLSQNEIEAVGLDAKGRTRLLDEFRFRRSDRDQERLTITKLSSLSAEISEIGVEVAVLADQIQELDEAKNALAAAEVEVKQQEQSVAAAAEGLRELDQLGAVIANRSVVTAILQRTVDALNVWQAELEAVARARPIVESLPSPEPDDPMAMVSQRLSNAGQALAEAVNEVRMAAEGLHQRFAQERAAIGAADDQARERRRQVESIQEGAGAAARRLAELRERVGQLEALSQVLGERRERLNERQQQRRMALSELEQLREDRFEARVEVARALTRDLGPQIEIAVQRSGIATDYAQAIAEVLRGSGLRYAQLSTQLANRLAPHELVQAAEEGNAAAIAKAGGISADRAERVVERIREQGVSRILSADVDDAAHFRLLVGPEYRDTTELSTGQRCTVVLPVLLHHGERPVVIDQPEDHLDNAFIVETLVKAMRNRPPMSQLIVSTHNPNVPVLGEASQVTVLGSDGKRGYEDHTGALDEPATVAAITSIMEGGREAFERRARFYESHDDQ